MHLHTPLMTAALVLVMALVACPTTSHAAGRTLWEATFENPDDAEQMLVRGVSPWYVHRWIAKHQVTDGVYRFGKGLFGGLRVTEQQIIGDPVTLTAEFRMLAEDNYRIFIGVSDYRGVETYLLGFQKGNKVGGHESMPKRLDRAREQMFARPGPAPDNDWHTVEITYADGQVRAKLDGKMLGSRKLRIFDGEGLGLSFLCWHARNGDPQLDIRRITFTSPDPEAKVTSKVIPTDRWVTPRYKFKPVSPNDPMIVEPDKPAGCEPPERLDGPVQAYGLDDRAIVREVGEMEKLARRWRFTGDRDCLVRLLRQMAKVQALQKPNGDFMVSGWIDSHKYHMWRIALALHETYRLTRDPRVREMEKKAAEWARTVQLSGNMNYNTMPVNLAKWYETSGDRKYIDRAWEIAKKGIFSTQEYNGSWAGHNSHTWYTGIGQRVLTYLAADMPADHPARDELLGDLRQSLNYIILSQAPSGGFYETWDRLEVEYDVHVDVVHPKASVYDAMILLRAMQIYDAPPELANATYGFMRYMHKTHGWKFETHELKGLDHRPKLPPLPGDISRLPLPEATTKPPKENSKE